MHTYRISIRILLQASFSLLEQKQRGQKYGTLHLMYVVKVTVLALNQALCDEYVWKSGDTAPQTLNLDTKWRYVVSFMLCLPYPWGKIPLVTTEQENG
jgi:hypothetical protein